MFFNQKARTGSFQYVFLISYIRPLLMNQVPFGPNELPSNASNAFTCMHCIASNAFECIGRTVKLCRVLKSTISVRSQQGFEILHTHRKKNNSELQINTSQQSNMNLWHYRQRNLFRKKEFLTILFQRTSAWTPSARTIDNKRHFHCPIMAALKNWRIPAPTFRQSISR